MDHLQNDTEMICGRKHLSGRVITLAYRAVASKAKYGLSAMYFLSSSELASVK